MTALRSPGFHPQLCIFRNTDFNYLKYYISGRKTDAYMQFATILQLFIVYLHTNCRLDSQLDCLPFRQFFTGIANITSTSITKSMDILISQLQSELKPAVCLSRGDEAIYRPPEYSWMSDKPQKQAIAEAAWATFSTNTCLNCQLMCTAIV